jgi:hypothetical protein
MTNFEPFETYEAVPEKRVDALFIKVWILVAVVFVAILGITARATGVLPYWVPLVGQDSGVAACEAIAASGGAKVDGGAGRNATDVEKIRAVRALFADSRHEDIGVNGVALMDLSVQIMAAEQAPDLSALALMGPFTTAYAGLAGGCAERGFIIPPMGGAK